MKTENNHPEFIVQVGEFKLDLCIGSDGALLIDVETASGGTNEIVVVPDGQVGVMLDEETIGERVESELALIEDIAVARFHLREEPELGNVMSTAVTCQRALRILQGYQKCKDPAGGPSYWRRNAAVVGEPHKVPFAVSAATLRILAED